MKLLNWFLRKKEPQLYRYEFPLIYPQGGSAGKIGATAENERKAREMVLFHVDPGKVIIGPATCLGTAP